VDHRKVVAATIAVALCAGCASARWSVIKHFRDPGESLVAFPEAVWEEYDCENQQRPFFIVEKNELMPDRVAPGGDFGHRFVYVMCPNLPTEVVQGDLVTRIRFKGSPIVQRKDELYEIKPGRWVVDSIVHLPEQAEAGIYAYEFEFESGSLQFDKSLTFVVGSR